MINRDKIRIMTKLASYEQHQGSKDLEIVQRTKFDYVSYHGFATLLYVTIGLLILFGLDIGVEFLKDLTIFTTYDYVGKATEYLTIWIFVMVVYGIITGRMYRKQYDQAKARVDKYEKKLLTLDEFNNN